MQDEIWLPAKGFEGYYEVSNHGRVRRYGRFLKTPIKTSGYCGLTFSVKNVKTDILVHRIVALTFIENPFNKKMVNHKDGNKVNNHVSNLEWVTPKENAEHARINELCPFGERVYCSILTRENAEDIRIRHKQGELQKDLASEFGVTPSTVWRLIHNKTWTDYQPTSSR